MLGGVIVQVVSAGLKPFPETATLPLLAAWFGVSVMEALGEPTVKVAPAKCPKLSLTFTT